MQVYKPGLHNVGSYQASGDPWISGSFLSNGQEIKFEFPWVTKAITVINTGSSGIRVHFASQTDTTVFSNLHYVPIAANGSFTYNVKCKDVYVSNNSGAGTGFFIAAELTGIDRQQAYALTGSGITG